MRSIFGLAVLLLSAAPAAAVDGDKASDAAACRINGSTSFLRDLLFGQAARLPGADQATVTNLKRASGVDLSNAQVLSYDAQSGRIECAGDVQLTVPTEAATAFGGKTMLSVVGRFTVEPNSDGDGYTIFASRMYALASKIASASQALAPTRLTPVAAAVPHPQQAAAPQSEPAPVTLADPHPAFDCALASTEVETLICGDSELAERDLRVSKRYFALRASLPATTRSKLLQSQRLFLKQRSQCATSDCLSALYDARLRRLDELQSDTAR